MDTPTIIQQFVDSFGKDNSRQKLQATIAERGFEASSDSILELGVAVKRGSCPRSVPIGWL